MKDLGGMEVKLDKYGHISVKKFGRLTEQVCPYHGRGMSCGDWCPHFRVEYPETDNGHHNHIMLHLCNGTNYLIRWPIDRFIDERSPKNEEEER